MLSHTSSRTECDGNRTSSGVTASRDSSSPRRRHGDGAEEGEAADPLFGIDPRYFSRRGMKTSLGGKRPTITNVHSEGWLARSLKMALAFQKLSRRMLQRLGILVNGWSPEMHFCTRLRNCDCGSRFSPRRHARRPSFTRDRRPRDFAPGSTGQRNNRFSNVRSDSRSAGEAEASRPVEYASRLGGLGSRRLPSRHSCRDSIDSPQIPSIIAAMEQVCASQLTAPLLRKPVPWCSVSPPHRRARSTISSSKRSVSFRKSRRPFCRITSSPTEGEPRSPESRASRETPRTGRGTPDAVTSRNPSALSSVGWTMGRCWLAQASKVVRSRVSTSSSSAGHGSKASAATPRMISATSELCGRSSFGRGSVKCQHACAKLHSVYIGFQGESGGVAILTTTLRSKLNWSATRETLAQEMAGITAAVM
mmetsp:Transcript_32954/g.92543  ORF Transcript_32954/g.92543 Transcript_32954/m.92543 type:complete len:421 (+) Transcript_32954:809-2071(+)